MPISDNNKTNISFKRLVGKSHTHNNFNYNEERYESTSPIAVNTVFADDIIKLPITDGGLVNIGDTDGVVEKVRFDVEIIPDTKIGSNQSQGYLLKLPTGYSGTSSYSGGTYLQNTYGRLQIIPSLYGTFKSDGSTEYDPILYQTNGSAIIPKISPINWILNTFDGTIFVQNPPANFDVSSARPTYLDAYLYVGDYLDQTLSGLSSTLSGGTGIDVNLLSTGDTIQLDLSSYTASTDINIFVPTGKSITFNSADGEGVKYPSNLTGLTSLSLIYKQYVDERLVGNDPKDSVIAASTGNIDLTGGTFLGILDGVGILNGYRILAKDQTLPRQNGIYTFVSSASTFVRASDFNGAFDGQVSSGAYTKVISGNTNARTEWMVTSPDTIVVGTSDINWSLMADPNEIYISGGTLTGTTLVVDTVGGGSVNIELSGLTKASNGLSVNSNYETVLGGTLTGNTVINGSTFGLAFGNGTSATGSSSFAQGCGTLALGNYSHAEGWESKACGDYSHAEGYRTCAIGSTSHSEGGYTCAMNGYSHAEGYKTVACGANSHTEGYCSCTFISAANSHAEGKYTIASGVSSHAEGYSTCAIGNYSHAEGYFSQAIGYGSHAEGLSIACGTGSHSQGNSTRAIGNNSFSSGVGFSTDRHICAGGTASFNHSRNTAAQTAGHGALADNSAILGGINHNIETGNIRAAIIGGDGIKLTGTSYIDTTAVSKLAIISGLTNNTSTDQVLVRNTSTGLVEYVSKASLTTGAANGLTNDGTNIVLGGTLTGNTVISASTFGLAIGIGSICASGASSFAQGCNSRATGLHSHAEGRSTCASGCESHAEGICTFATGKGSHSEGSLSCATGNYSHSEGTFTRATGAFSHAEGYLTTAFGCASHSGGYSLFGRCTLASGFGSFNHSANNINQTSGHGALAACSAILGGRNHNIAVGNTNAAIIGGDGIKLTGTTYIGATAVGRLVLITGLTSGSSDQVLIRNASTGIVEYVSKASLGGAVTASNGLTVNGSGAVVLGGTLTGNTVISASTFGLSFGNGSMCASGATSFAQGCNTCAIGQSSHAEGGNSCAIGNCSHAEGNFTFASGSTSHSEGFNTKAYGAYSHSEGKGTWAFGCGSHAEGYITRACGDFSHSEGCNTQALGNMSHSEGCYTRACRVASHSGGIGCIINNLAILAAGCASFNHSTNMLGGQSPFHGALSDFSAILGGQNHNIESGNTNAAIIGGNTIKLTGASYIDTTAVSKLALMDVPTSGGSDQVLIRNTSTGLVEYVSKASLGGAVTASNGLTVNGSGAVVLGGTLTGNTTITPNGYGILFGHTASSATGATSFGVGQCVCAWGTNSVATGFRARALGDNSIAAGKQLCAIGQYSAAFGAYTRAYGCGSLVHGDGSRAFGVYSLASGCATCSSGQSSQSFGRYTCAWGNHSHAEGHRTLAAGNASHSGGYSDNTNRKVSACGFSSFNHSRNNASQTNGHGANADYSAILGGINHNIESGNTGATIIGGNLIKLTGTSYIDTTAVSKLALMTVPTSGGSDQVLVRNTSTGLVEYVSKASLGNTNNILDITGVTTITGTTDQHVILVQTSGGTQTITLPSSPVNGLTYKIKDKGDALTNNVTIDGNGKNIDGSSTVLIDSDYGGIELIYDQDTDAWYILSFVN